MKICIAGYSNATGYKFQYIDSGEYVTEPAMQGIANRSQAMAIVAAHNKEVDAAEQEHKALMHIAAENNKPENREAVVEHTKMIKKGVIDAEYKNGNKTAKIQWDAEWEEFQVKFWLDGKFQQDATYHTDDLDDAIGTAKKMIE